MARRQTVPGWLVVLLVVIGIAASMNAFDLTVDDLAARLGYRVGGSEVTATYGVEGLEDPALRARVREVLAGLELPVEVGIDPAAGTVTCRFEAEMEDIAVVTEALQSVGDAWLKACRYESFGVRPLEERVPDPAAEHDEARDGAHEEHDAHGTRAPGAEHADG